MSNFHQLCEIYKKFGVVDIVTAQEAFLTLREELDADGFVWGSSKRRLIKKGHFPPFDHLEVIALRINEAEKSVLIRSYGDRNRVMRSVLKDGCLVLGYEAQVNVQKSSAFDGIDSVI